MASLGDTLHRLGLQQYHGVLVENGFQSWETVLDISEDDFQQLGFKLGHRRLLQREIATFRGLPPSLSLDLSDVANGSSSPQPLESPPVPTSAPRTREGKRRYRRHPRPDTNAPKKPKTAYVNFADHLRTDPVVSALSFVDIAKEVGRQWQNLSADSKHRWESEAARATQEFEAQMDEYKKTAEYRNYQAYLDDFRAQQARVIAKRRGASVKTEALARLEQRQRSPLSSSGSPVSLPSSLCTDSENCNTTLAHALAELVGLRREVLATGAQQYHSGHLPAEPLMRRAMYAFITGTGSLLYMWSYAQADDLLNRLYRPETKPDAMTVAEYFIIAAMGAHYDLDHFPDSVRQALYVSSTLQFDERVAKVDYLRTMRLLLSMSFYSLLEKHMSARYLVAAGLQIGRWKLHQITEYGQDAENDGWRRVFRSLVFMDCWLSYTLGYAPDITSEDVAISSVSYIDSSHINEAIHHETSRIGLIAAEVAKTMSQPSMNTRDNVMMLADKLGVWRSQVPPMLQMSTLTSDGSSELTLYQRRAILMLHIMYLGALVLLYRQLLVAAAQVRLHQDQSWTFDLSLEETQKYRDECVIAAQQMARILGLISFDGTLTKRCWLIIYWSFSATIILLFGAVSKMLDGIPTGIESDLSSAKSLLSTLSTCAAHEPVARRYVNALLPIYDALRDVQNRNIGRAKTSILSLLQPADLNQLSPPIPVSRAEVGPYVEELSGMLLDPFGRMERDGGRRVLSSDGSCTVFWWR